MLFENWKGAIEGMPRQARLDSPGTLHHVQEEQYKNGFHQRAVSVIFSVNVLAMPPQVHIRNYGAIIASISRGFSALHAVFEIMPFPTKN